VEDLLIFVNKRKLQPDILPEMLKVLYEHPNMQFSSVLEVLGYKEIPATEILEQIPLLKAMWLRAKTRGLKKPDAIQHWIMGRLRKMALGNIPLSELYLTIQKELSTNCTN
jgi:glutamyl-tRNA(Gln) amidotransferase subunit E